jgi:Pyruvate/2-oxoacid:ferredoxin oxidoreductase delta subunit
MNDQIHYVFKVGLSDAEMTQTWRNAKPAVKRTHALYCFPCLQP